MSRLAVQGYAVLAALPGRAIRAAHLNAESTDSGASTIKKLICLVLTLVCCMANLATASPSIAQVQERQTSPEEIAGWFEQYLHLGLADIAWGDLHNAFR